MAKKAKTKQPSAAQLRARRKFAAAAKARAKAARAAKKAAAPKKRAAKKAPSAAQLRARKKFAAAAKARAKAARAGRRNSTNIRAKRIDHLDVSKIHNPAASQIKTVYHQKTSAGKTVYYYYSHKALRFIRISADLAAAARRAGAGYQAKQKENPRRGTRKALGQALRFKKHALKTGATEAAARAWGKHEKAWEMKVKRGRDALRKAGAMPSAADKLRMMELRRQMAKADAGKRKNADHRDAQHPIHVTDYWQGRKGYKSQWQRAHEGGQRQLFQVKNPRAFSKSTVIGSQLWKALPADQRAVIVRQVAQMGNWRQASVLKLVQRVTGATKQPATYITAFLKIGYTVPLAVIEQAQRAGDPRIIDSYRKNGKKRSVSARASNGAGTSLARKRRAEFVGRPSKKIISTYAPKGSGAKPYSTLVAMGKLKKVYIKGRTPLNFNGAAILAHDPKTDKMFVLGREYTLKHLKKNPDGFEDLGEVTRIEYEATKTHLGDETPVTYFHKLGEEGGEKPHAVINEENLLLLEGGDYYITPEGIRD